MSAALNAIFALHRRSLLWAVMRIVRDPHTAEDLAQEAYVRAKTALETRSIDHLESYLYQTAKNLALDHRRRRSFRQQFERSDCSANEVENVATSEISAEENIIERERQRLFEEALSKLPGRAREAWGLSQIEGWSYQQIADHLNVSRNTVYNDIKMVIGHLRDVLTRLERG
ncbi:sigma-70 family RNA polymerase sigma factor [Agrobacterium sp. Ap1]|jgi:RNA polymerase sigma factor (sigma-70 family)|uniref:RNA polymerase sigma factor n=1 Tax=Agrobacterium sp. Ap1 TaxID=2815337 RepID=UPI000F8FD595|nr:sigma-70 family RNA polymerase sigma factor [Agrobacterium sp. Ap1]MBO0144529.1 sigma-70 family RNA polymerase sigma factor [Agrobacterium sp. Ap1]